MKWTSTFLIATLFIFILACSNDKTPPSAPQQVIPPTNQPAPPINTNTNSNLPTVDGNNSSTGTVFHYTCPNGHDGSASAGVCATCGATLAHNQAWHNLPSNNPNINTPTTTPQTPPASPARNAAGEWHYTCPNGHDGAGAAGACATCGATLAHNQAYHNTGTPATPSITTTPGASTPISPIIQSGQQTQPRINVPNSPGTATNSKGVYHYICPKGHAGGAASAIACASCGTTLVHNQAYHN